MVGRRGIEPLQPKAADLQSAELTTCSTYPRDLPAVEWIPSQPLTFSVGADDGSRTRNLRFTKPLLYQLSYVGKRYAPLPRETSARLVRDSGLAE